MPLRLEGVMTDSEVHGFILAPKVDTLPVIRRSR